MRDCFKNLGSYRGIILKGSNRLNVKSQTTFSWLGKGSRIVNEASPSRSCVTSLDKLLPFAVSKRAALGSV